MPNKNINHPKLKLKKAFFNIFLIISYLTTFSSCMTTYNYFELPESIDSLSASEMTTIELKNGEKINCEGKIIKFEKGADSAKYIILKSYTTGEGYKTYWAEKRISEKDIYKIYFEASETDGKKTALFVTGIVIVGLIAAFFIALAATPNAFSPGGFR